MHDALVDRGMACPGNGDYVAVVHYGSKSGELYQRVFKYSHKDPRAKSEYEILRDITQAIGERYREFIVAISVVKRCLHPKNPSVSRTDRKPHFERLFSLVVRHGENQGGRVMSDIPPVAIPYTPDEVRWAPFTNVLHNSFDHGQTVHIRLRGLERVMPIDDLLAMATN